jgi:hypothetical protein
MDPSLGVHGRDAIQVHVVDAGKRLVAPLVGVLAVDVVAGTWDLGYVPWILQQIGIMKVGGNF